MTGSESPGPPDASALGPDRLRDLGRVAGELLHDLSSTLALLAGRVSLAREEAAMGRIPSEELARIGADADELRQMILDVLADLQGRRPPLEETFRVEAALEAVAQRWLVGAPPVSISLRSDLPQYAEISGPRSFFARAVGNLLRNAARHARGEIRISAVPLHGGRRARIRVEDDGAGITEEIRGRLFEPLSSGGEGMGLGLSFARWGIGRLGGTLDLDPAPSPLGGASFRIDLPLSQLPRRERKEPRQAQTPFTRTPSAGHPSATGGKSRPRLDNVRVLLIDDDDSLRGTFVRLFRRAGAEVVGLDPKEWTTLAEAVARVRLAAPDVLLLDIDLGAYSGQELSRALQAQLPALEGRMVFFTGGIEVDTYTELPVVSKLTPWADVVELVARIAR